MTLNKDEKIWLENFKLLVDLIKYEGNLYWNRFNFFLAINSALLIFTTYILREVEWISYYQLILSTIGVFGMFFSFVWFIIHSRARRFYNHWIALARNIEELKLKDMIVFKKEQQFIDSLERWYEKLSITKIAGYIPLIFMCVWLILVILFWFGDSIMIIIFDP